MAIKLKLLGPEHPDIAYAFESIGLAYEKQGESEKANENYEKAKLIKLKGMGETLGDQTKAESQSASFLSSFVKGDFEQNLEDKIKVLETDLKTLAPNSPEMAQVLTEIAAVFSDNEEYEKAIEHYEKALDIYMETYGLEHHKVASVYNVMGIAYRSKRATDKAIEHYEKSLAIYLQVLGSEHVEVSTCYYNLATAFTDKKEYGKAIQYYEKSLAIDLKFPEQIYSVAATFHNIGTNYIELGDKKRAKKFLQKAKAVLLKTHGSKHPLTIQTKDQIKELKFLP